MAESKKTALPPIADIFKQAWDVLYAQAGRLAIVWLYSVAANIIAGLLFILLVGGYIYSRLSSSLPGYQLSDIPELLSTIAVPDFIIPFVILLIIFLIFMTIIGLVYTAAMILTLGDEKKVTPVWTHVKNGIQYAWPLFLAGIIVAFFALGGVFFFIVPYFIFMIAFCFYTYTTVFEKKKGMEAVQMSVSIVSQNFFGIFIRILLLWIAYFIVYASLGAFFSGDNGSEAIGGVLQFVISIILNMYAISFMYVLYRAARKAYVEKPASFTWIWVIAILGWIIMGSLGVIGYRALEETRLRNIELKEENEYKMYKLQQDMMDDTTVIQ